jgi:hypothetical protein
MDTTRNISCALKTAELGILVGNSSLCWGQLVLPLRTLARTGCGNACEYRWLKGFSLAVKAERGSDT